MRVSTSMIFQSGLQNLQRQQSEMLRAQTDIATGVKLRSADDDPVAFSRVSQLSSQQERVEQFLRNNDLADGKIRSQETRLAASTDILQRVREISLETGSILQDATSRKALSNELSQLREALTEQINARDERGEYVFAGTRANSQPFDEKTGQDQFVAGAAPTAEVKVDVGENQQVTTQRVATDIFTVTPGDENIYPSDLQTNSSLPAEFPFDPTYDITNVDLADDEADPRSALQIIDGLKWAIDNHDAIESSGADVTEFYSASQQDVDVLLEQVVVARGEMGNDLNILDRMKSDQGAWKLANEQVVSGLRDTDMAEAITRLNENHYNLQATQKSMVKIQGLSLFNNI
ncbi:flagellar hook-associated protein FlgL [Guyparkeria hydrothermalis]|uniref:flagellar hook-associated protein FlgL n=1 Tax=Guyparkeria hydrothermalis TaxID=923 RepID=UPI002020B558|nr:flagellar hook-associated protein FlgL [Guyparkeria hydrothermalis]MCL7743445.1 flagellar hook-associated protein FlgL [Guyparkeria hydrothermalis]